MGFREWLLKPYLDRLKILEDEVKDLRSEHIKVKDELAELLKALNGKADKGDLEDVRLRLNSLMKTLDGIIMKIESLEISLEGDHVLGDEKGEKGLVLRLIRKGYNTPKELKAMTPFGNKKLYEILRELEREGLIKTLKKKRRVYYVSTAEAEEG